MCLNRITTNNKPTSKRENKIENADGDSKFKTISQMNTNKPKKLPKKETKEIIEDKKNSNHNHNIDIKIKNQKDAHKIQVTKKEIKKKKTEVKNNLKNGKKTVEKKDKEEKIIHKKEKEEEGDDNDWYKELEAMITEEVKVSKQRALSVSKRKIKDEEIKNPTIYEENSNLNRLVFSNGDLKATKKIKSNNTNNLNKDKTKSKFSVKNEKTLKSSNTKYGNNIKTNRVMSSKLNTNKNLVIKKGKPINKPDKKIDVLNDYFSKNKISSRNNSKLQTTKTKKHVKIVKRDDKSEKKNIKNDNRNNEKNNDNNTIKQFDIEEDHEDLSKNNNAGRKRGLSCAQRTRKAKA